MPASIQYKSGYPSATKPFETSASIAADGLVTGTALFLLSKPQDGARFVVGGAIQQGYFSSLASTALSGLFVESRSLEKRGGLWTLRLNVVGALNPPIIERRVEVSPRSLSKTDQIVTEDETIDLSLAFDYLAESTSASIVIAKDGVFYFAPKIPQIIREWNRRGVTGFGVAGNGAPGPQTLLSERLEILESETREERAGIVRITKTAQAIYE